MKTIYDKAPVYLIDGTPGYLAGEWPGLKSNKFSNTRRVIRQYSCGIIFDSKEMPPINTRKLISREPSKEITFKPSVKMVKPFKSEKSIGYQILVAAKPNDNPGIKRKHIFESIDEYHKEIQRRERKKSQTSILCNDFGLKTGNLNQQFYDNISNNKLLGVSIFKDSFNFTKQSRSNQAANEFMRNSRIVMQLQEAKRNNSIQMEKKKMQKDIDYVTELNFWTKANAKCC